MDHPRAYGNFARLLGKCVREEKVVSLQEAVRRLAGLPAANLGLDRRGLIKQGYFADLVVFDPETISDRSTYDKPHQYATGVKHVLVNGVRVIENGEHTRGKTGKGALGEGEGQTVTIESFHHEMDQAVGTLTRHPAGDPLV